MKGSCIFVLSFLITCNPIVGFSQGLPIKPARTVSFTTDEGSYMNVDISPDGHTLLFDLLGDLYSVPSTGGKATQLTHGIALNLRPVWSPDGKKIAYISDYSGALHLNVRNVPGTFHCVLGSGDKELLSFQQDALWTPDGNHITVGNLTYNLFGGDASSQMIARRPIRYSSGASFVYYVDSGKLFRYHRETGTSAPMLRLSGTRRSLTVSPDDRRLAYILDSAGKRRLVIQDLAGGAARTLIPSLLTEDLQYNLRIPPPHFSFSPDSKSIFIAYGGKIHRIDLNDGTDSVVPFVAHVRSELGALDYHTFRYSHDSLTVKYIRSAQLDPAGRRLVFSALNQLYVMDIPGGKPRPLAPQAIGQYQPAYSPDGRWVAYVSWCDTSGGDLWRIPAAGGKPERLTHIRGQYQHPAWSPDGTMIAVIRGIPALGDRDYPGQGRLELVPVNGGPVRVVDDTVPMWNQLVFSRDGERIMYKPMQKQRLVRAGDLSLSPQLVSASLDGKDIKVIAVGEDRSLLQQRSLSPDGKFIVYTLGEDLFLAPVCESAGPVKIYSSDQRFTAIRFARGVDPYWESGGERLCWTYANRFYRTRCEKIVSCAERVMQRNQQKGLPEAGIIEAPVEPDQVVAIGIRTSRWFGKGSIVLRGVKIIPMHGDKVIEDGAIVVRDGRFVAVGPRALVPIPSGAKVFDLPGTTVMPGLIDLHLHMRNPPDVFPQQSWMLLINLAYGVTTARDPSSNFDSFGYGELLETGRMIGPRLFTVGRAARLDGMIRCENINDARELVRQRAEMGGTVIKQYELPTRLQREWLLLASREAGLNMTNEGAYYPLPQLGMIKDGSTGVEHNASWGDVYKDVISFIALSGTWLTPVLQYCYGKEPARVYFDYTYWRRPDKKLVHFSLDSSSRVAGYNFSGSLEEIEQAHPADTLHPGFLTPAAIDVRIWKQGGKIALGSHGNDEGIGAQNELWALQMGGLTNMQALQAATINGAEALGMQKDLGSIETGKIADLLILNGNPLDDIHNSRKIRYVMKDGILYDGDTLDALWPIAKKCPDWKLK